MFRSAAFSVVVLVGMVLVCNAAHAEPRKSRPGRARLLVQPPPSAQALEQQQRYQLDQSPRARYSYWRDIYPQFYGGFHYRQIYEFGPPGDFGFRGYPW